MRGLSRIPSWRHVRRCPFVASSAGGSTFALGVDNDFSMKTRYGSALSLPAASFGCKNGHRAIHHHSRDNTGVSPAALSCSSSLASDTGLFSIPGLQAPEDFLRLAHKATATCNDLRREMERRLESSDPLEPHSTLEILDEISNVICSVIDAAELCRSAHAEETWRHAASHAFSYLSHYIAELNADETLYQVLVQLLDHSRTQLTAEQVRFATLLRHEFERDGIHLPPEKRRDIQQLVGHITDLETAFVSNITHSRKLFTVPHQSHVLSIIPPHMVEALGGSLQDDPDNITLSSDASLCSTLLQYSSHASLRRTVYYEAHTSCPENLSVLDDLIQARHALATRHLGFSSYVHRILQDKMLTSATQVRAFLTRMQHGTAPPFSRDMQQLTALKRHVEGGAQEPLEPWDVPHYTWMAKSMGVATTLPKPPDDWETALAGYFTVDRCIHAMKQLVHQLFDMDMKETTGQMALQERWDGDANASGGIRKFQFQHQGDPLGTLYLDLHPRPGKYGHAAHFTVQCGCRQRNVSALLRGEDDDDSAAAFQLPIVALVCNFSPSNHNHNAVLSHSEVETLLHEFGHALHSILSRTSFQHLSGTRAAMDFIETPSHWMEHFAWDASFLQWVGEDGNGPPLSNAVVRHLQQSRHAFQSIEVRSQIVNALLDQVLFGADFSSSSTTTTEVFGRLHQQLGVPFAPHTHWHSRFGHLVTYGGAYYSYLHAQVFAADIWKTLFVHQNRRDAGQWLWKTLLSQGGAQDPHDMLHTVLGRTPTQEAFLDTLHAKT